MLNAVVVLCDALILYNYHHYNLDKGIDTVVICNKEILVGATKKRFFNSYIP